MLCSFTSVKPLRCIPLLNALDTIPHKISLGTISIIDIGGVLGKTSSQRLYYGVGVNWSPLQTVLDRCWGRIGWHYGNMGYFGSSICLGGWSLTIKDNGGHHPMAGQVKYIFKTLFISNIQIYKEYMIKKHVYMILEPLVQHIKIGTDTPCRTFSQQRDPSTYFPTH